MGEIIFSGRDEAMESLSERELLFFAPITAERTACERRRHGPDSAASRSSTASACWKRKAYAWRLSGWSSAFTPSRKFGMAFPNSIERAQKES